MFYTNTICSKCRQIIRRGLPRFGPARVRCGHCDTVMETGLKDWTRLSSLAKARLTLLELVFPSFFRGIGFPGKQLVYMATFVFASAALFWIPLSLLLKVLDPQALPNASLGELLAAFFYFGAPSVFVWIWFRRKVKQNQEFARTDEPPVWK